MGEFGDTLVKIASAVGLLIVFFYAIRFLLRLIELSRLYICSGCCSKLDFVEKYGKWAIVTGATDGIGQSMAKELARRGMSIIVVARNEEKLAATKAMLEAEPNVGEVETVKIDLSDPSMENFDRIRAQIDPDIRDIGVLINNAGSFSTKFARFNRFDMEEMIPRVNLNILATVHMTRMIMPGMIDRARGLVVNVSSIVGESPAPYMNVYGATKSFVDAFTRQLQVEYKYHPIDIILLQPGPVHTKLLHAAPDTLQSDTYLMPSSDTYARTSINAISTRIHCSTGYLAHEFIKSMFKSFYSLGLQSTLFNFMVIRNSTQLSPVPRRKPTPTVVPVAGSEPPATASYGTI